ncbi:MAG: energy-coupling factor ABC transporter substrate-binding protein [Bacillota bacterium]
MKEWLCKVAGKNIVLGLMAVSLVVFPVALNRQSEFMGADSRAQEIIGEIKPGYSQWFQSLWRPPGSEVESLIFALQAALGSGFIGYYIGFKKGRAGR